MPKVDLLAIGMLQVLWTETQFADWAMYSSDLFIKILPLQVHSLLTCLIAFKSGTAHFHVQLDGNEGGRHKQKGTVIWDRGRLLAHFDHDYVAFSCSAEVIHRTLKLTIFINLFTSSRLQLHPHQAHSPRECFIWSADIKALGNQIHKCLGHTY